MATKLNERAYQHAQNLIKAGHCVLDEREDWSEAEVTTTPAPGRPCARRRCWLHVAASAAARVG